jgi:hypothetical protein
VAGMKTEAQRIAIAEACGWKFVKDDAKKYDYVENPQGGQCNREYAMKNVGPLCVPDYLNDLNAMHEAEKVLTLEQTKVYTLELFMILERSGDLRSVTQSQNYLFAYEWHATAAQRAEAFLRTIGKWEESP